MRRHREKANIEKKYIVISDLIKLGTNMDSLHYYSFGDYFSTTPNRDWHKDETSIHLRFNVADDVKKPRKLTVKFDRFWGRLNEKKIYYEQPLLANIKAKLLLELTSTGGDIIVNKIYYRFVRFKIENVFPPGIHLTDLTMIKMLEKGYVGVHSSCISLKDRGVLIFAPPRGGKSLTLLQMIKKGYNYVSDDTTVIDGRYAYPCPYKSTISRIISRKPYTLNLRKLRTRVLSYFIEKKGNPFLNSLRNLQTVDKVSVNDICILERGKNSIEEVNKDEFLRRLLILNRQRFSYYRNNLFYAYSYFNPNFCIKKLMEQEKSLFTEVITRANCYILKANDPRRYVKLLERVFG